MKSALVFIERLDTPTRRKEVMHIKLNVESWSDFYDLLEEVAWRKLNTYLFNITNLVKLDES